MYIRIGKNRDVSWHVLFFLAIVLQNKIRIAVLFPENFNFVQKIMAYEIRLSFDPAVSLNFNNQRNYLMRMLFT